MMCHRAARQRKGKPVVRRGRKATELVRARRVSRAASAGTSSRRGRAEGEQAPSAAHPYFVPEGHAMLARIRKAKEEGEGGFTLIELLVVVIIIGILAAIAIPVFLNQRKKGYDAQAKSDLRNVATLQETYLTDNNVYAPAIGTLTDFKASPNATTTV